MKKHRLLCNNNWGNINKPTAGEVHAFENWNRKFTTDICGFLDFETVWLLRTKIVSRIQSWKCWWQKTLKIMIMEWLLHLIMLLGIVTHCWKFWWQEPQRWIWTHSTFLGYKKKPSKKTDSYLFVTIFSLNVSFVWMMNRFTHFLIVIKTPANKPVLFHN